MTTCGSDRKRREIMHSGGAGAFLVQPHTNYRTLDFDKALSTRRAQKIVKKWADYSRLGDLSPHDLHRTAITRALESGLTYRQVQMMSKLRTRRPSCVTTTGRRTWSRTRLTSCAMKMRMTLNLGNVT